jgi:predicted PP-loop superfamily ATPase
MKPSYSCEKGEFHFCRTCHEKVMQDVVVRNTKPISIKTNVSIFIAELYLYS